MTDYPPPLEWYMPREDEDPPELARWRRALVDSGIATPEQADAFAASVRRQEAERRRESDRQIHKRKTRRRGFARLLNIGS